MLRLVRIFKNDIATIHAFNEHHAHAGNWNHAILTLKILLQFSKVKQSSKLSMQKILSVWR